MTQNFGADASRIAMGSAGDSLGDANLVMEEVDKAILKLSALEAWLWENTKLFKNYRTESPETDNMKFYDDVFEAELKNTVYEYCQNFDKLLLREVLKTSFFNLNHMREDYRLNCGNHGPRRDLIIKYVEIQLTLIYPVAPHFAEIMWKDCFLPQLDEETRKGYAEFISNTILQEVQASEINRSLLQKVHYLKRLGRDLRVTNDKQIIKKKGKNKQAVIPPFTKCTIVVAGTLKDFQLKVLDVMKATTFDESKKPVSDYKKAIKDLSLGKLSKNAFAFATTCIEEYAVNGTDAFNPELPYDELQLIKDNEEILMRGIHGLESLVLMDASTVPEDKVLTKMAEDSLPGNPQIVYE